MKLTKKKKKKNKKKKRKKKRFLKNPFQEEMEFSKELAMLIQPHEESFLLPLFLRTQVKSSVGLRRKLNSISKTWTYLKKWETPITIIYGSISRTELDIKILLAQYKGIFYNSAIFDLGGFDFFQLDGDSIIYKTVRISLVDKSKQEMNPRYREKQYGDKKNFIEPIQSHKKSQTGNGKKKK
jgi:hypothetical protein